MEAKRKTTFGAWFATFVLCCFFWILLTGSFAWQELVAGAVVSAGVALFSAAFHPHLVLHSDLPLGAHKGQLGHGPACSLA